MNFDIVIFIRYSVAPIFYKLLYMSVTALVIGVIIMLIRRFADKRLSPFWKYAMWGLVLIALIVPYRIQSETAVMQNTERLQEVTFHNDYVTATAEYKNLVKQNLYYGQQSPIESQDSPQEYVKIVTEAEKKSSSLHIKSLIFDDLLPALWLFGFLIVGLFMFISRLILGKKIRNCAISTDTNRYEDILEKCKKRLCIKRKVNIVLQNHLKTPAILGSKIILPDYAENFTDERLEYVILHELSHLKRCDGMMNLLLLLLQTVYWFNPLLLPMFKFIRQDMELVNDAYILKIVGDDRQKDYSLTLVDVLANSKGIALFPKILCMTDNKSSIERRIKMIKLSDYFKKNRVITAVISIMLIGVIATLFLTMSKPKENAVTPAQTEVTTTTALTTTSVTTTAITENTGFNVRYIRTSVDYNEDTKYPLVTVIKSRAELESYCGKNYDVYDYASDWENRITYAETINNYTDEYFENNFLVIVTLYEGSGSNRHSVEKVDNGVIYINRLLPGIGTCDIATWNIAIEMNKELLRDEFTVSITDVRVADYIRNYTQYIRTNSGSEYPAVTVIDSIEELKNYSEKLQDISFADAIKKYDKKFDKNYFGSEQFLVVITLKEPSSSIRHSAEKLEGNTIYINRQIPLGDTNTEETEWSIIIELGNSYLCDEFNISLTDVNLENNVNAQIIRTDRQSGLSNYYPVVTVIKSKNELDNYYEQYKDTFDLRKKQDGYPYVNLGYSDRVDKYNDKYFEDKFLIMLLLEDVTGSAQYEIEKIYGNAICVNRKCPDMVTTDEAAWSVIIEMENEFLCDDFIVYQTWTNYVEEVPENKNPPITETPPEFISLAKAREILKPSPVGAENWRVLYSDWNYIYISALDLILRYNVVENNIDKALRINPDSVPMLDFGAIFDLDGIKAYVNLSKYDDFSLTTPHMIYLVDFESGSITLTSRNSTALKLPQDFLYRENPNTSTYSETAKRYVEFTDKNSKLPKIRDWCEVMEIQDQVFALIMPSNPKDNPGNGYFYFKIIVVDINRPRSARTYEIQDLGL